MIGSAFTRARLYQTRSRDEKETDAWPSINGRRINHLQQAGIGSEAWRTKQTPFIVQVDEVGQFQWPDGGFQEVTLAKGEWAGPIEEPTE